MQQRLFRLGNEQAWPLMPEWHIEKDWLATLLDFFLGIEAQGYK